MPIRLDAASPAFSRQFADFLAAKRESAQDVEASVRAIIADVVARGDQALVDLTKTFDRADVTAASLRISDAEIKSAAVRCDAKALDALKLARDRIESITPGKSRRTNATPMRLASSLAIAGQRWRQRDFMFPAVRRHIHLQC